MLIDAGMKAAYQDEFTIGVDKAIDSTFTLGAKYIYRTLGRTIENLYDIDPSDPATGNRYGAIFNPGGSGPAASGQYLSCNWSENPTDPAAGICGLPGVPSGPARRLFRGLEVMARKQVGTRSGLRPITCSPAYGGTTRGPSAPSNWRDQPRNQLRFRLLPVRQQRLWKPGARPAARFPARCCVHRAVQPPGRPQLLGPRRGSAEPERLLQHRLPRRPLPRAAR